MLGYWTHLMRHMTRMRTRTTRMVPQMTPKRKVMGLSAGRTGGAVPALDPEDDREPVGKKRGLRSVKN